jgi:hypothetical protein
VGNPAFFPDPNLSAFTSNATLKLTYTQKDYLTGYPDIRWMLQASNDYSQNWDEKSSFYFLTIVDDNGSSLFNSITNNLTVAVQ